ALWHEVQEAYAAGDVAHMEILLALCDIESNHTGAQTSIGQMRAVLVELERALRALEKSLLEAEGEDAWNFAQTGPNADLRLRVGSRRSRTFSRAMMSSALPIPAPGKQPRLFCRF